MQKVVNQIYWDETNNTYTAGTQLKKKSNNHVYFKNNLMSAGKIIVFWTSSNNYQSAKQIPHLPMLISGHKYKIDVKAKSIPANSFICCLRFYNLQGDEIKNIAFNSTQKSFVYPSDAISYRFELINGGCKELEFERVQIADNNMPDNIFDDIFVQTPINAASEKQINLLLVVDSKRSRKLWPELKNLVPDIPLQIINISWQYEGNLIQELLDWISVNINQGYQIISGSSRLDKEILEIRSSFPQIPVLTSKDFEINEKKLANYHEVNNWYSESIYDPDWLMIVEEIKDYFGK